MSDSSSDYVGFDVESDSPKLPDSDASLSGEDFFFESEADVKILSETDNSDVERDDDSERVVEDLDMWIPIVGEEIEPTRIEFFTGRNEPGPQTPEDCLEPFNFFQLFFTDELFEDVIVHINEFAKTGTHSKSKVYDNWTNVTVPELKAFVGIAIDMGVRSARRIEHFFQTEEDAKDQQSFNNILSNDRFKQIFKMLYLRKSKSSDLSSGIKLIEYYLLDYLDNKFREYYVPNQNIVVGESQISTPVDLIRSFNYGVKMFIMADCTNGYVFSFLNFFGNIKRHDGLIPGNTFYAKIIMYLYDSLVKSNPGAQGYHIFSDRNYTSIQLGRQLLAKKCYLTGILICKNTNIMRKIIHPKLQNNQIIAYRNGELMILAWRDKTVTTLLSTWHSSKTEPHVRKRRGIVETILMPCVVIDCNNVIKAINEEEDLDHLSCLMSRTNKVWQKMFFWSMEMAIINAYILYKHKMKSIDSEPISDSAFRRQITMDLVKDHMNENPTSST